jgi:thiosulfate dehydrogenase
MPAFRKVLMPVQEWQVSLLLANADKPLPPPVISLLQQPLYAQPAPPPSAPAPVATPPAVTTQPATPGAK